MSKWLRRTAGMVGAGSVAGAIVVGAASRRWQRTTDRLSRELVQGASAPAGPVSLEALDSLPTPVLRYFRAVLREGHPYIGSVRIEQAGAFRSEESPDPEQGWQPFKATQLLTAEPPGFLWDARIRMAPLVSMRVRDGYVRGHASVLGALLGTVPVVNAADEPQLRAGALQRYLAESVWIPTALLPRDRLRWFPIDETHARARLTVGETVVTLDFEFGPGGEIVSCYAPSRGRAVPGSAGRYERPPWGGRYRRYEERDGMRVPLESEVYWVVNGKEQPYYRGSNLRLEYGRHGVPVSLRNPRGPAVQPVPDR